MREAFGLLPDSCTTDATFPEISLANWSRKVAEILCTFNIVLIMQDAAVSLKLTSTQQVSCIQQYLIFFVRIGMSGGDLRYFVFVSRPSIFSLPSASGQYENARLALRVSPLWPL